MVVYGGPDIVTDGLLLHLDAGNSKSYPGSGTSWSDLSGNNNNGTLFNSPAYTASNKGSLIFDGINEYATLTSLSSTNDGFTIALWINPATMYNASCPCVGQIGIVNWGTGYSNWTGIASNGADFYFAIYSTSSRVLYFNATTPNAWYYIVATFGPSGASNFMRTYRNGILHSSSSLGGTGLFTVTASPSIAGPFLFCGNCFLQGQIPQLTIYNRPLIGSEVLQNYNATKGRYGL